MQTFCQNFSYTSSEIDSKYKFGHGKFEIKCKLPKGKVFFPAFWTYGGPRWNEIDVFEFWNETNELGNYDPSKLSKVHKMNIQYDYDNDGNSEKCPTKYTGPDFSQDFHIFTLIWTPFKVEWYVDGNLKRKTTLFYTMLGQMVDCNGLQAFHPYILNKAFPRQPMNIIANLAIQSGSNSPDENTTFPSALEIDYIRYYKQIPCNVSLDITDISSLNLNPEVYNVIIGTSINLNENFTVQNGQQLEVIAQNQIILGPGFTAEAGSNFIARIDDGICDGINKIVDTLNNVNTTTHKILLLNETDSSSLNILYSAKKTDCNVKVFPNPTKNKIKVEIIPFSINKYKIYLTDMQGNILYFQPSIKNYNFEIDMSNYSHGTYLLNVIDTNDKKVYSHKIIK